MTAARAPAEPDYEPLFRTVEVRSVSKVYGKKAALSAVSMTLRGGSLTALLGDNGAGKSTLVGVLSTLTRPNAGTVRYGDLEAKAHGGALRAEIGLVAHESFLYGDLTGRENLELYAKLYGLPEARERARAAATRVGLTDEAALRQCRTYSRGMLQRLSLARALIHEPQLLLLDEPFTGLDRTGQLWLHELLGELKAAGRIVVVVTHDISGVAGIADHVVVLRRGKVVVDQESPSPMSQEALIEAYTGKASG